MNFIATKSRPKPILGHVNWELTHGGSGADVSDIRRQLYCVRCWRGKERFHPVESSRLKTMDTWQHGLGFQCRRTGQCISALKPEVQVLVQVQRLPPFIHCAFP